MKVAIYGISKNEINNVDRFMNSVEGFPVYILDHSTDGTADALRARGAHVDTTPITPFDFDKGKNAALALCPEVDFVLNLDLDEALHENARKVIEKIEPKTTMVRHLYQPDAAIDRVRHECRLHSRNGYRWRLPIHEHLKWWIDLLSTQDYYIEEKIQAIDELLITQYPNPNRKHTWSEKLLDAVLRFPNEPRLQMLCGRDLYFDGRIDEALEHFHIFVKMKDAEAWDRSYVHTMIAKCYAKLKRPDLEMQYLIMSEKAFRRRESLIELAYAYLRREEFKECIKYCGRALSVKEGEFAANYDPGAWSFKPYEMMMMSYYNLGLKNLAESFGEAALMLANGKDFERIKANLEVIKS